jgi:DNA-binding response OmpR family regulator
MSGGCARAAPVPAPTSTRDIRCRAPHNAGVRLLLIEDSDRLREGLVLGLGKMGFAVDAVGDGVKGLSYARNNPYDVVILDLMLPGLDGITLLRTLREEGCDTHVLILTARDRVEDRVIGLQAGADDYLVKPFAFDELVERIRALVRRRYGKKQPELELGGVALDRASGSLQRADQEVALTPREFQLLEFLGLRAGEVVSRIEIEDAIYDEHTLPSGNAVDSAICRLRAKLETFEDGPRIETRRGLGYVLVSPSA